MIRPYFALALAGILVAPLAASAAVGDAATSQCVTIGATGPAEVLRRASDRREALIDTAENSFGTDKRFLGDRNCIIIITARSVGRVEGTSNYQFSYQLQYSPITTELNDEFQFLGQSESNSPLDFDAIVVAIAIIETNNWPRTRLAGLPAKKAEICRTNEQHQNDLDRLLRAVCRRWRVTRPD